VFDLLHAKAIKQIFARTDSVQHAEDTTIAAVLTIGAPENASVVLDTRELAN
jgi:hypothetical protein